MSQVDFTLLLFNQHTETWIPRCGATGQPNGLESFARPGLTDELVWLQKHWEAYLDRNHILLMQLRRRARRVPVHAPGHPHRRP